MRQMYVIGEDALCCALGERLVRDILGWSLAQLPVDKKGVTRLKSDLSRNVGLARASPVLCLADTDGKCAVALRRQWLPQGTPRDFLLRLAAPESESWLLADRDALAGFFRISASHIPARPDELSNAKQVMLNLAKRSRDRTIRTELVSDMNPNRQGTGYNVHLCDFVKRCWRPSEAQTRSPSLARAVIRLRELAQ